jgi:hypothetical protein
MPVNFALQLVLLLAEASQHQNSGAETRSPSPKQNSEDSTSEIATTGLSP